MMKKSVFAERVLRKMLMIFILCSIFAIFFLIYSGFGLFNKDFHCRGCNVLLVTMDALRADHVGAYGYQRNTTPNIDSLAKKGVMFENYIVNAPVTHISLPSLMSSKIPVLTTLNRSDIDTEYYFFVSDSRITLTEFLKHYNYTTIGVINNDVSFTNTFQGFDNLVISDVADDRIVASNVLKLLEQHSSEKFFLRVHFISPHAPYRPPYPFNETFFNDSFYDTSRKLEISDIPDLPAGTFLGTLDLDYYISQYDGEIRLVDYEIGVMVGLLANLNLSSNTLIIVSADHGESFGEHGNYFAHGELYDTNLRVPLIFYNPKSNVRGKAIYNQVQEIDLYPTLADILELSAPTNIDGVSFYNLFIGKHFRDRVVFSIIEPPYYSFRTNMFKYIHEGALYNLVYDPQETNNIFDFYNITITNTSIEVTPKRAD